MKRRLFLVAIVAAALPSLPVAEQRAKLGITLTTALAAPPAEVWSVIGDFQEMSWHPVVHDTTGSGGTGTDATRRLVLGDADGPTIDEQLDMHSTEDMRYAYRITRVSPDVLPVTDYSSQLSVKPRDGGGSIVAWHGTFLRADPNKDAREGRDDAAAKAAVKGVYQAGLDALDTHFGTPGS